MKKHRIIFAFIALLFITYGCKTGKKAYEHGDYYLSVLQSVDKLRKNPNNKKARASLVDAYPLAIQTIDLSTQNLQKSNDPTKWRLILANYDKVNRMYEEILRSPEALKIIGSPKNYYAEMENVKKNAAQETYDRAMAFLLKGTREDAKSAYRLFQEAQTFVANFKDSNDRMEEARQMATLYVMVSQDPVPEKFAVSGNHFRNKIDEFLHSSESRLDFIEFYNPKEMIALGIQPDHEIVLRYQDFSLGNVFLKEETHHLSKDSVIVATYERDVPMNGSVVNSETGRMNVNASQGGGQANAKSSEGKKYVICHKPDENGHGQTLEVSANALQAHLNHGDVMGSCKDDGEEHHDDGKDKGDDKGDDKGGDKGDHKDDQGNDNNQGNTGGQTQSPTKEKVNVYATVKATLVVNRKTITSNASLAMTIYETNRAGRVLKQEMIPVEYVWKSEWGYFNGDERALTEEQLQITKQKELPPPDRDEMFNLLAERFYYVVTQNIRSFYQAY